MRDQCRAGHALAYALHRGERAGRAFAGRVVAAMPVAVPPITLGFGYLIVFNTDAMPWLGSTPLLIAAHAIATCLISPTRC